MSNQDNQTGTGPEAGKKKAAAQGPVVESTPVEAGDANKAAARGREIKPADSNLLGKPEGEARPAAAKKAAEDKPMKLTEADAAKADAAKPQPADTPAAKPQPAEPPKSDPPKSDPAPAAPPPVPVTVQRRGGFWPLAFGGAVAAGLGAAAAIWTQPYWTPERPAEVAPTDSGLTLDEVRAEISTALAGAEGPDLSAFEARLDQVVAESREAAQAAAQEVVAGIAPPETGVGTDQIDALTQRLDEKSAQIDAQAAKLDEQAAQIAELEQRPDIDPELAARIQELTDQAGALEDQIQTAAQEAQSRITDAQAEAERLQEAAAESTRRAEALAAIAALQTALDRGVSTDEAAAQLRGAGVEPPEAVTAGAPTLAVLQTEYDAAARAALRAALRSDAADDGAFGAVGNFLRAQTGARSLTPREGADPDAVLSRAGAAVQAGDIRAALAEIDTLPEPARAAPAMADWLAGARAHVAAHDALTDLSGQSNPEER